MNVLILFALSRWTSVSFEFWTYDSYHKYVDSARRSASILVNCNKLKSNTIVLQSNGGHVCAPPSHKPNFRDVDMEGGRS